MVGVGYEGRTVGEFIADLRADDVRIVVDVRVPPRCGRRGFSRHALAETLRAHGIQYVHYEALGNPEYNQAAFRASPASAALAARRYREHLDNPAARAVLRDLIVVATRRRVAVMTLEVDADRCHRATLLAEIARLTPKRSGIDEVLADYAAPAAPVDPVAPTDTRTQVERDIDELLAEFSPGE